MTIKEYCEISLEQCDEFKDKWAKLNCHDQSKIFEGMAEAYADLLHRIETGELT